MHRLFSSLFALLISIPAHAYYAVLDNGEILPSGQFKLTPSFQSITDSGGANVSARVDAGLDDEFGMRGLVGFGKTDFFLGGILKWMPVPDIEGQPAIGMNMGLVYAKYDDIRDATIRFEPLVSKRMNVDTTVFTPYASIPLGIRTRSSDNPDVDVNTKLAWQLVVGTQLQLEQWKKMQFIGELGINLDNAPSHLSVGAIFYFDENGLSIE